MKDFFNSRLAHQQLITSSHSLPQEVVAYMGAMQAQNYAMVKWGIAGRMFNALELDIENSINEGTIIRTHLLRPTWHCVAAQDVSWMLKLTAPRLINVLYTYGKQVGISSSQFLNTNNIVFKILASGIHYTRKEVGEILRSKYRITSDTHQLTHIMFSAELAGIACSGALKGKEQTYALLESRIPPVVSFTKDESLAKLASTYFISHAPATLFDFIWWSGLTISDAKRALEMIKSNLIMQELDGFAYWSPKENVIPVLNSNAVRLLPAFDEYLVGYKNRDLVLAKEIYNKVITSNGIFKPVVIKNGQVIGIWKTNTSQSKTQINVELFEDQDSSTMIKLEKEIQKFNKYKNYSASNF